MSAQEAREIYQISRKVIYDWKQLKLKTEGGKRQKAIQMIIAGRE